MTEGKFSAGFQGQNHQNGVALYRTENPAKSLDKGQVNWAFQHETFDSDSDTGNGDDIHMQESHYGGEQRERTFGVDTHSIILDISTTSFVDTVTVKTLKNVRVCKGLHMMAKNTLNKNKIKVMSALFS